MVEKILNNTTPYGKIRASHEGSLHSSTLSSKLFCNSKFFNSISLSLSRSLSPPSHVLFLHSQASLTLTEHLILTF